MPRVGNGFSAGRFTEHPAASARWVLLVEDNPGDAELTCELLEQATEERFIVRQASSMAAAVDLLAAGARVEAIILDLNLPDSQGIDTVRRARHATREAPIIALTGLASDELRLQAKIEGAEDLFGKNEANSRLFWRSVLQIINRKREQQRQFQGLIDASPDGIVLTSESGQVRYLNRAAVDLFGQAREDLMGKPFGLAFVADTPMALTISHSGGVRECEVRAVRLEWDDEPVWMASIRDVTDRNRAVALQARSAELEFENRRIAAASQLKSEFLANMSHELRTPLNAIIGFSQLLRDGVVSPGSPKYDVFLGHILASGWHLLQLINDVLDMAKVEAGKLTLAPEPVDLRKLTEEVSSVLSVEAAKKRVSIEVNVDSGLGGICIDPGRYKQVLYNYLSNALKFTAEDSGVSVTVAPEDEEFFRVVVRDAGVGIAQEDMAKLFSAFQQLDSGAKKQHQGTGLGLALTKRIVEAQGGYVGMTSVIGEGSEFFAVLPRLGKAM